MKNLQIIDEIVMQLRNIATWYQQPTLFSGSLSKLLLAAIELIALDLLLEVESIEYNF